MVIGTHRAKYLIAADAVRDRLIKATGLDIDKLLRTSFRNLGVDALAITQEYIFRIEEAALQDCQPNSVDENSRPTLTIPLPKNLPGNAASLIRYVDRQLARLTQRQNQFGQPTDPKKFRESQFPKEKYKEEDWDAYLGYDILRR